MSIERQHGKIIFICDCCDDAFDTDSRDFTEALQNARQEDWKSTKSPSGTWEHYCPKCKDF